MNAFTYNINPGRVLFGVGTMQRLGEEIDRLSLRRLILLSTPSQERRARAIADMLHTRVVTVFPGAVMHTPDTVTETAMKVVSHYQVDGILAVGGGSTIGLGKAIALRTDLPQIIVPTTYAGSEMTPILGETKNGLKVTQSSPKILPEVVIYDVELTMSLPPSLSGASGINAIAHAVEALYAKERNPIISMMASEAIRELASALPIIFRHPRDENARWSALYGAWLCGTCLGSVGMSLHHKLCHTLGGSFGLPHAETHAVILPHALAYNAPAVPDVMSQLRTMLHTEDPALALFDLAGELGAERSLIGLGMKEVAIDEATDRALANPYWNPRLLEKNLIRNLIARAVHGEPPMLEK